MRIARGFVVCVVAALAGCGSSDQAHFATNLEGRDLGQIRLSHRDKITEVMDKLFGTPDAPRLPEGTGRTCSYVL